LYVPTWLKTKLKVPFKGTGPESQVTGPVLRVVVCGIQHSWVDLKTTVSKAWMVKFAGTKEKSTIRTVSIFPQADDVSNSKTGTNKSNRF
jgi:hypothetical protein